MVKTKRSRQTRPSPAYPKFLQFGADSWDTARTFGRQMIGWAFRGQPDPNWGLKTTIERATEYFNNWTDLPDRLREGREDYILEQFRRRAHHYLNSLPPDDDLVEWFALIQHYGGPTRLLDFTHSFYVAAFFALERAEGDASVWAVNLPALSDAVTAKTGRAGDDETIFDTNRRHISIAQELLKQPQPLVVSLEPDRMNERLSAQQGLFLWPCDLSSSFEQNLTATFDLDIAGFFDDSEFWTNYDETGFDFNELAAAKITIPRAYHLEALADLANMNVTARSLFPGLDGFARSLYFHLRIPKLDELGKYEENAEVEA